VTEDGSLGFKGKVTTVLKDLLTTLTVPALAKEKISTYVYACGPKAMFLQMHKVLKSYPDVYAQVSFEQFMGCGVGTCCGCVIETKDGYKKVCKDGPTFNLNDIW